MKMCILLQVEYHLSPYLLQHPLLMNQHKKDSFTKANTAVSNNAFGLSTTKNKIHAIIIKNHES